MSYVFTDHARQTGLGRQDPERLRFTWEQVAASQQIDPSWDYRQAVDVSLLP
jgi:hypothetical protein